MPQRRPVGVRNRRHLGPTLKQVKEALHEAKELMKSGLLWPVWASRAMLAKFGALVARVGLGPSPFSPLLSAAAGSPIISHLSTVVIGFPPPLPIVCTGAAVPPIAVSVPGGGIAPGGPYSAPGVILSVSGSPIASILYWALLLSYAFLGCQFGSLAICSCIVS